MPRTDLPEILRARSAALDPAAAHTPQPDMQDWQPVLQMLPAAPPLRPAAVAAPVSPAALARCACNVLFLPVLRVAARLATGAQAAQLLGRPSRPLNPRTGSTPAARPPTPQAASGRAGLQVAPCAAYLGQGCPSMPCATAGAAWDKTGYGCLARLVPRTGLACPTSCKQVAKPSQLFKVAVPQTLAAHPQAPRCSVGVYYGRTVWPCASLVSLCSC